MHKFSRKSSFKATYNITNNSLYLPSASWKLPEVSNWQKICELFVFVLFTTLKKISSNFVYFGLIC